MIRRSYRSDLTRRVNAPLWSVVVDTTCASHEEEPSTRAFTMAARVRAVILAQDQAWDLLSILDVVDKRSLFQLLDRGGVREMCRQRVPRVAEFLATQRFLANQEVLEAVSHRLNATKG